MMRLSLLICFALFSGSSAFAESSKFDEQRFRGTFPQICLFDGIEAFNAEGATVEQTDNGLAVTFAAIADPETSEQVAFNLNVSLDLTCNFVHQVSVRSASGGLLSETPEASPEFSNRADYSVQADWAGGSTGFSTTGTAGEGSGLSVSGVMSGRFDLSIASQPNGLPLQSGAYSDTLVIEISSMP